MVDPERSYVHVAMPYPGGLHIFANYHVFQMGPLPLVFGGLLSHIGPSQGHAAAVALIEVLGLGVLFLFERIAFRLRAGDATACALAIPLTTLIGGFIFLQAWTEMSGRWAHLDDALALFLAAIACWAISVHKPSVCGVALGLAIGSKPWAVGFSPLILVFAGRARLRAAGGLAVALLITWGPFVAMDWRTIQAGSLPLFIQPASPLRVFGVQPQPFSHGAEWRLLQFAIEIALVYIAVRMRSWSAALLLAVAARLVMDPVNFSYYEAGFAAAAIGFDLMVWRRSLPIATLVAGSAWAVSAEVGRWSQYIPLFACFVAALVLVAVAVARRQPTNPGTGASTLPTLATV